MRLLNSPIKLFWAGAVCVTLGFVLPLLIVVGFIKNSIGLSFLIYILQLIGIILGVVAAAGLAINRRGKEEAKKDAEEDEQESTTGWME